MDVVQLRPRLWRWALELPVEALLLTHGEAILEGAGSALERALQ